MNFMVNVQRRASTSNASHFNSSSFATHLSQELGIHYDDIQVQEEEEASRRTSGNYQKLSIVVLTESQETAHDLESKADDDGALERALEKQGLVMTKLTINLYPGSKEIPSWVLFVVLGAVFLSVAAIVALVAVRRHKRNDISARDSNATEELTSGLVFVSQAPSQIIFPQGAVSARPPLDACTSSTQMRPPEVRNAPTLED